MNATAVAQSEKQFMGAVVEYAKFTRWKAFHPFDSRRSDPGWPDLSLVRGPRLLFAELKAENGKLTHAQLDWLEALGRVGTDVSRLAMVAWEIGDHATVEVYVWRPSMWSEIEAILR